MLTVMRVSSGGAVVVMFGYHQASYSSVRRREITVADPTLRRQQMKCPACNKHELCDRAWLPVEEYNMYESECHYDCANCGPITKDYVDAVLARLAAAEAASKVLKWISVLDRLPDDLKYTHALVTLDNGDNQWVAADRYDGYSKSWENHYDPSGTVCVTHWMPLPAPPATGDSHE